jgi:hypothetical protein
LDWVSACLDQIEGDPPFGYVAGGVAHPEPTALCGIAFDASGRVSQRDQALQWLARSQARDGAIGAGHPRVPTHWATSLAVLAWSLASPTSQPAYRRPIAMGIRWLLGTGGTTVRNHGEYGHTTTLMGWPWVDGTHSWIIPTAFAALALKSAGHSDHPRCREAIRLLVDRLLERGGCNYGNTTVFGRELRPQIEPTGVALLALAGEEIHDPRPERSLDYLHRELSATTPPVSLCYGLLGLAAHGRLPADASAWLATAAERVARRRAGPHVAALLRLAALGSKCPLIMKF